MKSEVNAPIESDDSNSRRDIDLLPDSLLVRHICGASNHVVWDDNLQCRRISSAAFSPSSDDSLFGMSVDLGQLLEKAGKPLDATVGPGFGAVSLRVGPVRSLGLKIIADPIMKDNPENLTENLFHGLVLGVKTSSLRRKLYSLAERWILPLHDVQIR